MDVQYLLFYRWLCVNLVGFSLLFVSYLNGWVNMALAADPTHIIMVIFGIFLWGLIVCGYKVWSTSSELNYIRKGDLNKSYRWLNFVKLKKDKAHQDPAGLIEALKLRQFSKVAFVKYIAHSLVIMGLIGTVVGFIIALSGVNPSVASDISAIFPMVSTLIYGMSVALYTTLVGAVLNIWLTINYHILAGGTAKLVTAILETTENVE